MAIKRINGNTYSEYAVVADPRQPLPVLQGFALPPFDSFVLNDEDKPTEITYSRNGAVVATVTLTYAGGGTGALISGSISQPGAGG
jgi:hypothetical protein